MAGLYGYTFPRSGERSTQNKKSHLKLDVVQTTRLFYFDATIWSALGRQLRSFGIPLSAEAGTLFHTLEWGTIRSIIQRSIRGRYVSSASSPRPCPLLRGERVLSLIHGADLVLTYTMTSSHILLRCVDMRTGDHHLAPILSYKTGGHAAPLPSANLVDQSDMTAGRFFFSFILSAPDYIHPCDNLVCTLSVDYADRTRIRMRPLLEFYLATDHILGSFFLAYTTASRVYVVGVDMNGSSSPRGQNMTAFALYNLPSGTAITGVIQDAPLSLLSNVPRTLIMQELEVSLPTGHQVSSKAICPQRSYPNMLSSVTTKHPLAFSYKATLSSSFSLSYPRTIHTAPEKQILCYVGLTFSTSLPRLPLCLSSLSSEAAAIESNSGKSPLLPLRSPSCVINFQTMVTPGTESQWCFQRHAQIAGALSRCCPWTPHRPPCL